MLYLNAQTKNLADVHLSLWRICSGILLTFFLILPFYAQQSVTQPDDKTIIAEGVEVYSFGKTVIVKKEAKDIFVIGGDIIVEGKVEGDVAIIGGSITQKEDAYISGDVIVIGGAYNHESKEPLRGEGKQSIVIKGFEGQLQSLLQNPSQLFAPQLTWGFLAQRLLAILFWFIVSLALTTIAPGAMSRSVARFQLSMLKVVGIGLLGFFTTIIGIILSLKYLPSYLSAIVWLMSFLILVLSYVFGRAVLQVSVGKWLQKRFLPENRKSETLALLIGTVFWTAFLSLPYVWTFVLLLLFAASLGLVLTARSSSTWQKA